MSKQLSWDTFFELARTDPERAGYYACELSTAFGWLTRPYYEKGIAEGEARGELRGLIRGEARGEAKALVRLLKKRFGEIPAPICEKIFAANVGSIEIWADRAFAAPDLESVFSAN